MSPGDFENPIRDTRIENPPRARARLCDAQAKEEVEALEKKMQQLENELAQTQTNLEQATTNLEEKEKALQNVSFYGKTPSNPTPFV